MKQSRSASLKESVLNTAIGFGVSLLAQMIFLPLLGVEISHAQNFYFACIMTVVSILRGYGVRRLFEALHIRRPLSPGMLAVIAERYRQQEIEGWTIEHDDKHAVGELARAGAHYLLTGSGCRPPRGLWPWDDSWEKPDPVRPRRDLVRGLALGLAELEKFDRSRKKRA